MWPMTGGCHVAKALNCENYKKGCGNCKQLMSKNHFDLSYWVLKRKKKYLSSISKAVKIIGISDWISKKAKESALFKRFDIRTISNNINIEDFYPIQKKVARQALGIHTDKKIILVGAINLKSTWKGFNKFFKAINKLDKTQYYLCIFGKLNNGAIENLGFEHKIFGYLHDILSLRVLYSATDVLVAPSIMDSFGKILAESMACRTPVVSFNATGPKDIITHKVDGYKAKPFESEDLPENRKSRLFIK